MILFICTGNYYRSRFAEAYFNYHSDRLGLGEEAFSRGLMVHLAPAGLSPHTRTWLHKLQIEEHYTAPERVALTSADLSVSNRIIALYEKEHRPMIRAQFPDWEEKVEYWKLPDLDEVGPEETLAGIQVKVDRMLDGMKQQQPSPPCL